MRIRTRHRRRARRYLVVIFCIVLAAVASDKVLRFFWHIGGVGKPVAGMRPAARPAPLPNALCTDFSVHHDVADASGRDPYGFAPPAVDGCEVTAAAVKPPELKPLPVEESPVDENFKPYMTAATTKPDDLFFLSGDGFNTGSHAGRGPQGGPDQVVAASTVKTSLVPEPSSFVLLGIGVTMIAIYMHRRRVTHLRHPRRGYY